MVTLNNNRQDKRITHVNEKGLTLVELMVALVLFLIVVAGIYETFNFQQESYMQTESRVDMVQEARAAQFFMARDLKMAGYNPTTYARTGFDRANVAEMIFSMDIDGNGDPAGVEVTNFALTSRDGDTIDSGICPDGNLCRLSREWCSNDGTCGGMQPIAENVAALELCYIIGNMRSTTAPTILEREKITSVIISLLMRQAYRSNTYENTNVYMPASGDALLTPTFVGDRSEGWGPFNDAIHRKLIIFEVKARNMGLNTNADL